jgi:hypothetical protein
VREAFQATDFTDHDQPRISRIPRITLCHGFRGWTLRTV